MPKTSPSPASSGNSEKTDSRGSIDTAPSQATTPRQNEGKGAPTPTRREREAANARPLVPGNRRENSQQRKQANAELRAKTRAGIAAGDERYLPLRDKGPQKRFIRDYVDARFNVGEFLMPAVFIVLLATFLPVPAIQLYSIYVLWVFLLIAFVDSALLTVRIRRKLTDKFGSDNVERGVRWYTAGRALQLRSLRLPKPQTKRRQFPS